MTTMLRQQRWRPAVFVLVPLVALMLTLGTAQGRGTAADVLGQFRSDRLEAVSLSTSQIVNVEQTLSQLEHIGTVSGVDDTPQPHSVANITEASRFAGFDVLQPDAASLPSGFGSTPSDIRVVPDHEVRFTIDLEKARTFYQSSGQGDVSLPTHFDGAALVVRMSPTVLMSYGNLDESGNPSAGMGLVIGQTGTISADAVGSVTLEELRDFLLGLPTLSPEIAQQLREIDDWRTTLPIPIPVDEINWERAMIAGRPGLLLNDNTGMGSAAIWQSDGQIYGIAGAVKAEEIKRVAEALR